MKLERKYMAHYLNAHFAKDSEGEASYVRLGADLEEYSPELSANVERRTTSWVRPLSPLTATRNRAR